MIPEHLTHAAEALKATLDRQASPQHTPAVLFQYTTAADLEVARNTIIYGTLVERDPAKVAIGADRDYPTSQDIAQFEWTTRMPDHQTYYLNGAPVAETLAFLAYDGYDPKRKEEIARRVIQEAAVSFQRLQEGGRPVANQNVLKRRRLLPGL